MIGFRRLARADLPTVSRWLIDPIVHRWWYQDASAEAVAAEFGPSLEGLDPMEVWIVTDDDRDIGLVQCERFRDEPGYRTELRPVVGEVDPDAASIDYLLGEPDARGRGLGAAMLRAFVDDLFARDASVPYVLVPVARANVASWGALRNAGFVLVAEGVLEPDNPIDDGRHVVWRRDRE